MMWRRCLQYASVACGMQGYKFENKIFKLLIVRMMGKHDDRREVLRYASDLFEVDSTYAEKKVNELLGEIYEDYALLRRYL